MLFFAGQAGAGGCTVSIILHACHLLLYLPTFLYSFEIL